MSERDFTQSVRGLGPNHIKADCSHEARRYRHSTDIEVSEASYNCKIGFIEILVFNISFKYQQLLGIFDISSKGVVHHTKFRTPVYPERWHIQNQRHIQNPVKPLR